VTTPTLSTIPLADVNPTSRGKGAVYTSRLDPRPDTRAGYPDPAAGRVVWAPVVAGLWSASDAIGHVGLVEQRAQSFTAIDGRGHALGTFAARRDAEGAVEEARRRGV
jgi:hypothetical protein